MRNPDEAERVLSVSRQIPALTLAATGNVSQVDSTRRTFWVTPSGMAYDRLVLDDLVQMSLDEGRIVHGHRRPSTEWRLHRAIYHARSDVGGIVHVHSLYATIFATLNLPIEAVHYQLADIADSVPVAAYATFGTEELAARAVTALGEGGAVLLQNHGLVAVGADAVQAYHRARDVEWVATVYYHARQLGQPRILTANELQAVREALTRYGQPSPPLEAL